MKKIIPLFILIILLSACGGDKTPETKSEEPKESTTAKSVVASSSEETMSEAIQDKTEEVESETEAEEIAEITENIIEVGENAGEIIDLEEKILLDNENLEVKIMDIDLSRYPANDLGPSCMFFVTNKTDKFIFLGIENVYINGVELPTVYEEIAVPAGETVMDILPLAKHHFLDGIVNLGEVKGVNLSLYTRDEENNYYEDLETVEYMASGEYEPYDLATFSYLPEGKAKKSVKILGEYLYDNGVEIVVPFTYAGYKMDRVIVPKTIKINGEKEVKCVGYQKVPEKAYGFGEAFIDKEELGEIEIKELEIKFDLKNKAGEDFAKASASTDVIGFIE